MERKPRYRPEGILVVPAYTAQVGDTIMVYPAKQTPPFETTVRRREEFVYCDRNQKDPHIIIEAYREVALIVGKGKRKRSIGGGTAIQRLTTLNT